jgi:hypothetical protein
MSLATNKYKKRLSSIKNAVVKRFGKGKPTYWRNRDFEDLSFEINKTTRVLISAATLKRIFGKNKTSETYYPQESTLMALEKYAALTGKKSIFLLSSIRKKHFALLVIPILIFGIVFLFISKQSSPEQMLSVKLELNKIDGANPATAFFSYNVPKTKDSLFVSFGDGHPLQYISANNNTISHYYRHPGMFNVCITARKQVLSDTIKLYIPTNGWQALAYYYQQDYTERYFPVPMDFAASSNGFHLTRQDLASIGMDTTQIVVLRLDNFKKTGISGDSFNLKTRIKNVNYWPAIRCYSGYIKIIGESASIIFKLTNEGCSQFGEFTLSEKNAQGSNADLSSFSLDIKNWNDVKIINNEKNVRVIINTKTVFQESYNNSIGAIVGVSLQFHGSGYVDYFQLYDKEQHPVFSKEF